MLRDTRLQDLENENYRFQELLRSAEDRIRVLENALRETSSSPIDGTPDINLW
jgi:hypothetical protein